MLPHPDLAPHYDKVTWLFVTRNFKEDAKDLEAKRTHDRFGISSWPQMMIFDPRDDRVVTMMPRQLEGFIAELKSKADSGPSQSGRGQRRAAQISTVRNQYEDGEKEPAIREMERIARGRDAYEGWIEARELLREWRGDDQRIVAERLDDPDPRERAIAIEEHYEPTSAVAIDRRVLSRALVNLVENALQAMPNGGTLSLSVAERDDEVVLSIADDGAGLEPEVRRRLFEPYFSTKSSGTGLGLHDRYVDSIEQYRNRFTQFVEEQGGNTFTMRVGHSEDEDDEEDAEAGGDVFNQGKPIDLRAMPRYEPPQLSAREAIAPTIPDIGLLGVLIAFCFAAAFTGFLRYDVRPT